MSVVDLIVKEEKTIEEEEEEEEETETEGRREGKREGEREGKREGEAERPKHFNQIPIPRQEGRNRDHEPRKQDSDLN